MQLVSLALQCEETGQLLFLTELKLLLFSLLTEASMQ